MNVKIRVMHQNTLNGGAHMPRLLPKKHEHWGHAEGEWKYSCCACEKAAPDSGCPYCLETYYRAAEPDTYEFMTTGEGAVTYDLEPRG